MQSPLIFYLLSSYYLINTHFTYYTLIGNFAENKSKIANIHDPGTGSSLKTPHTPKNMVRGIECENKLIKMHAVYTVTFRQKKCPHPYFE